MLVKMKCANAAGGGVKGTYDVTSSSSNFTIDTGLGNNLKRFVAIMMITGIGTDAYIGMLGWDADHPTVGAGTTAYPSGAYGSNTLNYNSSYANQIVSVSNGVITIKPASDSRYVGVGQTYYWYAE